MSYVEIETMADQLTEAPIPSDSSEQTTPTPPFHNKEGFLHLLEMKWYG